MLLARFIDEPESMFKFFWLGLQGLDMRTEYSNGNKVKAKRIPKIKKKKSASHRSSLLF